MVSTGRHRLADRMSAADVHQPGVTHVESRSARMSVRTTGEIVDLEIDADELAYGGDSLAAVILVLHNRAHTPTFPPAAPPPMTDVAGDAGGPLTRALSASTALHDHLDAMRTVRGLIRAQGQHAFGVCADVDVHGRLLSLRLDDSVCTGHPRRVETAVIDAVNGAIGRSTEQRNSVGAALRNALENAVGSDER